MVLHHCEERCGIFCNSAKNKGHRSPEALKQTEQQMEVQARETKRASLVSTFTLSPVSR